MTCMRVLTRSSGAHTTDAKEPEPTPASREERKACLSCSPCCGVVVVEEDAASNSSCSYVFIFREPDHERRRLSSALGLSDDGIVFELNGFDAAIVGDVRQRRRSSRQMAMLLYL
jgi:hypothetical protein